MEYRMIQEKSWPMAYFITFTCYGTWLHGEEKLSVFGNQNHFGSNYWQPNPQHKQSAIGRMKQPPYLLDQSRRNIVLKSICNACEYKQWTLFAAHVRTNHVHMVIHALHEPEIILNTIKVNASRQLNELGFDYRERKRWTEHGSTRYLWRSESIIRAVEYVVYEQGEPMEVFDNQCII